jgi:hypothetical protein
MQKSTAGKFHRFLPAPSRNARLDAEYVNDEARTHADGTSAAHCHTRDFGTSSWQLSETGELQPQLADAVVEGLLQLLTTGYGPTRTFCHVRDPVAIEG